MNQEMEYIYRVFEDRNFSRAAEALHISQPALSIAIKKVEDRIGMPIFDRTTRPISLTPAGEVYIEHIRQTVFLEQEMEQQLMDIKELNTGRICIGGSQYLNAYILPRILTGFSDRYPGVSIELLETSTSEFAELLNERELDLTFSCEPKLLKDFEHYPAFKEHILLAVPKEYVSDNSSFMTAEAVMAGEHLLEDCKTVSLADFSTLPYVLVSPGNNMHDRGEALFAEAGIAPRVRMSVSQLVTAYRLADAGMGATFVCDRLVSPLQKNLVYYKLKTKSDVRQFHIFIPRRRYTPLAVKTFIKYFKEQMK